MGGADSVLDMAQTLASEGNSSDAEALIRFALGTDPESSRAHIMLARLRHARGEKDAAIEALIDAARRQAAVGAEDPAPLYAMLAAALELDPARLDVHVDLAEIQAAHDDVPGAQARLVQLSAIYVDAGRHEDARTVLAVASGWDPQGSVAGVIETSLPMEESIEILLEELEDEVMPQPAPTPQRVARTQTICTPTLLRDAQGRVLPNQACIPRPALERSSRPSRPARPIPAPPLGVTKRPSTGRSRTVPVSLRTLRARVQVRHEPEIDRNAPLASRLRRLGSIHK